MLQVTSIKSQNEFGLKAAIKETLWIRCYGNTYANWQSPKSKKIQNPKNNLKRFQKETKCPKAQLPKGPSVQRHMSKRGNK